MEKRNIFWLLLILVLGIFFRTFAPNVLGINLDEENFLLFPRDLILADFFKDSFSPIGYLLNLIPIKLPTENFKYFNLHLFNDIFGILSIISVYFLGKNFGGKNPAICGLISSLIVSLSAILIYLGNGENILNLSFFISSLIILMSSYIIIVKEETKYKYLHILSILLFLIHPISIFFIIANYLLCFAYSKSKFPKFFKEILIHIVMALPLCVVIILPIIKFKNYAISDLYNVINPFILMFSSYIPDKFNNFSPILNFNAEINFYIFAILPIAIALIFILFEMFKKKKGTDFLIEIIAFIYPLFYIFSLIVNTSFTFSTLVEIYPAFVVLFSTGFCAIKYNKFKITLFVIFLVINLFYFIVANFNNFNILGNF